MRPGPRAPRQPPLAQPAPDLGPGCRGARLPSAAGTDSYRWNRAARARPPKGKHGGCTAGRELGERFDSRRAGPERRDGAAPLHQATRRCPGAPKRATGGDSAGAQRAGGSGSGCSGWGKETRAPSPYATDAGAARGCSPHDGTSPQNRGHSRADRGVGHAARAKRTETCQRSHPATAPATSATAAHSPVERWRTRPPSRSGFARSGAGQYVELRILACCPKTEAHRQCLTNQIAPRVPQGGLFCGPAATAPRGRSPAEQAECGTTRRPSGGVCSGWGSQRPLCAAGAWCPRARAWCRTRATTTRWGWVPTRGAMGRGVPPASR